MRNKKHTDVEKGGKIYRSVDVALPEREPGEDAVTPNQLRYIRKLAPGIQVDGGLENLGKWQASTLIDQIKEEKEKLQSDLAAGQLDARPTSKMRSYLILGLLVVVLAVYSIVMR